MQPPNTDRPGKLQVLREVFGFDSFRPGQEEVIDALSGGENVLAVMPTGSGKSLCFQIPALIEGGLTVVVSPLVSLMQDQISALKLAGVMAETINSTKERAENVATWRRVAAGEINILYLSPERLMTERMLEALKGLPLSFFVVDEAHCISQWGPAFRPEYDALSQLKSAFPNVPLGAFTATADEMTRKEIAQKLFSGPSKSLVLGFDRPNIRLSVQQKGAWRQQVLAFLGDHAGESGIVYCLSRKKTEETAAFLREKGFQALPYHAGMDKSLRLANQDTFMTREGVVIVATIAFGMGIDKPDVRFVLHTDLPGTIEAYYQEFGRAGRDGKPADALMLYGLEDIRMRRRFIEEEETEEEQKRRQHKRLDALLAYCEAPQCRRIPLLTYFGDSAEPCGNCDICTEPVKTVEGSEIGRKALAAVDQTGQRFGAVQIIDVLRGAATERVRTLGHDQLASFGSGAEIKKAEWKSILRQLVAGGFLKLDIQGYGGLSITLQGDELLRGEASFRYRQDTFQPEGKRRRKETALPKEAMGGEEAALLSKLKELRLRIAKERSVPAFVVFHDRTLAEIAKYKPKSKSEFAAINGVGAAKLEDFAEPFLELISQHGE